MSCRNFFIAAAFLAWLLRGVLLAELALAERIDPQPGQWSGGMGLGFLTQTPDGVAEFGVNGHADYFVADRISVGPLVQYAGIGNDFLFGLSGQVRYWWPLPSMNQRAHLVFQGGLGFIRSGIVDTDSGTTNTFTSFLIPIGAGVDYRLTERLALTVDVVVNLTALGKTVNSAGREFDLQTNVMPALYLGVRF